MLGIMDKHRNKGVLLSILLILLISIFSCGCISSGEETVEESTITITDMQGRTVTVPSTIDRFVAIEAGALRYAVYAGASDRVVGVEDIEFPGHAIAPVRPYSFAHMELRDLPSIGPFHGGDSELIAAVEPEVIFWTYAAAEDADVLQQQTGIPVICIVYGNLFDQWDTMCQALRLYGEVLDTEDIVESQIAYIESLKEDLIERTSDVEESPSVYIGGVAYRGPHSIDSTNPVYEPFVLLNANNVASDISGDSQIVDPEIILVWDPDYIFIDESSYEVGVFDDLNSGLYDEMTALENGQVYGVFPYNWYTTNWSTIFVNAYYIGSVLYPEQFEDIIIDEKADEIFSTLVGAPIYDDMCGYYGGLMSLVQYLNE